MFVLKHTIKGMGEHQQETTDEVSLDNPDKKVDLRTEILANGGIVDEEAVRIDLEKEGYDKTDEADIVLHTTTN